MSNLLGYLAGDPAHVVILQPQGVVLRRAAHSETPAPTTRCQHPPLCMLRRIVAEIVRMERTNTGQMQEHRFYDGFDVWGYGLDGDYDGSHERAPFQRSPFRPADEP